MSRHKGFIQHFFLGVGLLVTGVLAFVTWVDPFRNLSFPWAISFVSDRNIAYKKFKLLENVTGVTDLIIGSSTSEAFVPQVLKDRYGIRAFSASTGGASLPIRYLLAKQAIRTQPALKRIIYVADLFEFADPGLTTNVYYQPEMMREFDAVSPEEVRPGFADRSNDFLSYLVIDRSIRTLKDFAAYRRGKYVSAYHDDGSTTRSMIGGRAGGTIETRALASAIGMEPIYFKMTKLHPTGRQIFQRLVKLVEASPGVELHIVVSPFHEVFFNHFRRHFEQTGVYAAWLKELADAQASESRRIFFHDFSYPRYLEKGIILGDSYWQDGVHITSALMLKMAGEVYDQ